MGTLRPGNFAYGLVVSLGAYFVKKIGALSRLASGEIWNVKQLPGALRLAYSEGTIS